MTTNHKRTQIRPKWGGVLHNGPNSPNDSNHVMGGGTPPRDRIQTTIRPGKDRTFESKYLISRSIRPKTGPNDYGPSKKRGGGGGSRIGLKSSILIKIDQKQVKIGQK